MPSSARTDIVRRLFAVYAAKDREAADEILAYDFTFTSPYDDAIDKAAYFERCWPAGTTLIKSNRIETVCECGDEVFVLYKCVLHDGKEFRNTEVFRFDGERIKRIDVYFGAAYRGGQFLKQS